MRILVDTHTRIDCGESGPISNLSVVLRAPANTPRACKTTGGIPTEVRPFRCGLRPEGHDFDGGDKQGQGETLASAQLCTGSVGGGASERCRGCGGWRCTAAK